MVAAIRPLRVEELAEIFAIEFGTNDAHNLVEGWRPENPEEALLSVCSTLITIIDDEGSKIAQFLHFSVKEFLTSDRLQTSNVGNICQFYVRLDPAHTILVRACLTVLLQIDEKLDRNRLVTYPLAFYAARHWSDHAKFGEVGSQIQDSIERLFSPKEPYFRALIWIRNEELDAHFIMTDATEDRRPPRPPSTTSTPLWYTVDRGFSWLVEHLIITQSVDAKHGFEAPLHLASSRGMFDIARLLLDHEADVNIRDSADWTPLHCASLLGHVEMAQLLLVRGASLNAQSFSGYSPLFLASRSGQFEAVQFLLDHGADMSIKGEELTPFQDATRLGHHDIARLLLEHGAERK
jgi:hypothetical protein